MVASSCSCENGYARFTLNSAKGKWEINVYPKYKKEVHKSFWLYKNAIKCYEKMLKKYDLH